ncbi:hypothetical protein Dda_5433 [Drechslerella dactyloides]|uniref:ABM domain-containing protein n=1 Tax=Drechslerella dactyloides TaxID=74499 RepID=A0AAD6NIV1_DREDA|nr:hypothetical protein Dda_5433 [Drechslerella dactyloides]
MSEYVTEVVTFNLRDGITRDQLLDPASPHAAGLAKLKEQPGCEKVTWGLTIASMGPDPRKLLWFVEWDDISSHKKFMAQPYYQSFVESVLVITDTSHPSGPILVRHYPLSPPLSTLLSSLPASDIAARKVEYLTTTVKPDIDVSQLATDLAPLGQAVAAEGVPSTFAYSVEDAKAMLVLNLWKSIEQNMAFVGTEAFKMAAGPMGAASAGPPVVMHFEILG